MYEYGAVFFKYTTTLPLASKRLDANGNVVVYLKNTAPYSYMIRYGEDAQNAAGGSIIAPQGKRVADETLLKPMRKQANKVVKALANDLTRRL